MWFDFGRSEGYPTQYPPNQTPVTVDVLEAGFIAAFIVLAISFIIALPTTNWLKNSKVFIRVTVQLVIGLLLLLCNFGQEWEVGHITTNVPYKAGVAQEIENASIGLKIGLRSVNVTLKSDLPKDFPMKNETINYNERFEWTWDQGRFGFGPYAGHLQQEFRAAQYRGVPIPILWVMEYFIIDGEGFRFGRFYRTAGWYCHICIWIAFTCWLISIILLKSVISYSAYFLGACGVLLFLSNILWAVIRNPIPLKIAFEDGVIQPVYGGSFWLTMITGIICCTISLILIIMDWKWDTALYTFFDHKADHYVDYLSKGELAQLREKKPKRSPRQDIPLLQRNEPINEEENDDETEYSAVYMKRPPSAIPPKVSRATKPKHLLSPA